jgi:hypothetical protein
MLANPRFLPGSALLVLLAAVAACGGDAVEEPAPPVAEPVTDTLSSRYHREYLYLGERGGSPLVVSFSFRAVERGDSIHRTARAELAHGETWDSFLDEEWWTLRESGVWRILPHGDLRLAVGGPAELEALWFQRGERALRLQIDEPVSGWHQANAARYRLATGRLLRGAERTPGLILESLQVSSPRRARRDADLLFLTAGDSLTLVLGETLPRDATGGGGFAWTHGTAGEQSWGQAEVRWIERRALEEARRDIPLHWSFRVPEAAIHGEVSAIGMETHVGPERPGRRAVEIRYTVEGWIEVGESRSAVMGVVKHIQE